MQQIYEQIITWIHNVGIPLLGWFALFTMDCWETNGAPFPEIRLIYVCEYSAPVINGVGFVNKRITVDEYGNFLSIEEE